MAFLGADSTAQSYIPQDNSFELRMNLKVAAPQGMGLDVLTDKPVTYKVGG